MTKVFKGDSRSSSNQLMNIKDSKVYKGDSTSSSNQLMTVRDGKVYRGDSTSSSNQLMTIDGPVTLSEFAAIWYAYNYIW